MLHEIIKRKEYYQNLAGENNIIMEKVRILKHRELGDKQFVQAKYLLGEGGKYKQREFLETYENGSWIDAKAEMSVDDYNGFLSDCTECNF